MACLMVWFANRLGSTSLHQLILAVGSKGGMQLDHLPAPRNSLLSVPESVVAGGTCDQEKTQGAMDI